MKTPFQAGFSFQNVLPEGEGCSDKNYPCTIAHIMPGIPHRSIDRENFQSQASMAYENGGTQYKRSI